MRTQTEINQTDKLIRKQWIQCSFVVFIAYPLLLFAIMLIFTLTLFPHDTYWKEYNFGFGVSVLKDSFFFAITYYFAYHKFGTKWLTWCLFISPLMNLLVLVVILNMSLDVPEGCLLALELFLYVRWYVLTWKLRKANRKIKLYRQFPQICTSYTYILEQSHTFEALRQKYLELIKMSPYLEPILTETYESKKARLSNG